VIELDIKDRQVLAGVAGGGIHEQLTAAYYFNSLGREVLHNLAVASRMAGETNLGAAFAMVTFNLEQVQKQIEKLAKGVEKNGGKKSKGYD